MAERVIYPVFHSAVSGLGPGGVGLHPAVLSLKSAVPCGQDPLRWSLSSRVGGYHTGCDFSEKLVLEKSPGANP